MSIQLPKPVATYFAKDKKADAKAISECFTETASVTDEGNTYTGREAIRQWMANASTKYTYTVEPFAIEEQAGKIVVSSHLVGNFPGSPVDLRYFFVIEGDKIAKLEIIL